MIDDTAQIESLIGKNDTPVKVKANAKGDKRNIFVLLVLYTLQGIPLGFSLAIPIIIQSMHQTSFKEQAKFSLAVWPFSMKLLWAPLVDSLFIKKLGRRKSWLVPVQYLLGIFFLITGYHINDWLVNASQPQMTNLTIMFFILNFLAATQDIVVDGWALTMLKRKNVSYAAMCNGAGQSIGIFLGNILLIMLVSKTFWNKWLSSPMSSGLITLQGYFYFWGVMFMVVTTLVAVFKYEKDYIPDPDDIDLSIIKTYKLLYRIIKLPNILTFVFILLTIRMSFSSIDSAYKLKLVDGGITKDQIAAIELLFIPLRISLPFIVTKFTSKEKPLINYSNAIPYRLLVGVILTVVIYLTPYFLSQSGILLIAYKSCLVFVYFLQQIVVSTMMLLAMSFYASISDPKIGGTNMTLLSTIGNIGMVASNTGALWLIEFLTFKQCSNDRTNLCSNKIQTNVCKSTEGTCQTLIDGFYIETCVCTIYGVIWFCLFRKIINKLQSKKVKEWHVDMKKKEFIANIR